jgi:hypothetical protein
MKINWKSRGIRYRLQETIFMMTHPHFPHTVMIDEWLDTDEESLQHFCAQHSRVHWLTGIGVIEAAYLLIETALENGNIDCDGNVML